jgi:two-component system sensor histidine kinase VicK
MGSIRWKLVFMYLILVFIVMLISGTFIIQRIDSQEMSKAEYELKSCASYINEQIIK